MHRVRRSAQATTTTTRELYPRTLVHFLYRCRPAIEPPEENAKLLTVNAPAPYPPLCLPLALGTRVCVVRVDATNVLLDTVRGSASVTHIYVITFYVCCFGSDRVPVVFLHNLSCFKCRLLIGTTAVRLCRLFCS